MKAAVLTSLSHIYSVGDSEQPQAELEERVTAEKKTVISLLEAFAVAVKHHLRDEDGSELSHISARSQADYDTVEYEDLYHLLNHLPAYERPIHSCASERTGDGSESALVVTSAAPEVEAVSTGHRPVRRASVTVIMTPMSPSGLPLPATAGPSKVFSGSIEHSAGPRSPRGIEITALSMVPETAPNVVLSPGVLAPTTRVAPSLRPAWISPKWDISDYFPFSFLAKALNGQRKNVSGKKAVGLRTIRKSRTPSENIPMKISLYLASLIYMSMLDTECSSLHRLRI
jgi:ion channel-forming bestrophin family protein